MKSSNRQKLNLGIFLFVLGIIGVLSILTMKIPIPPEAEATLSSKFSPQQIKLLFLINPTILLVVAVFVGVILYKKVNLGAPVIEKLINKNEVKIDATGILRYGVIGGIIAGMLLSLVSLFFDSHLPEEFVELGEKFQPSLAARFLYGGLTEEILMRFGFMTLMVWIFSKIFKGLSPITYWTGILIAAIIFAIGHFPIAYQAVENPSVLLLTYILIGNSIGGIIFGWLYWKKGLESAFLAHIFTHVIMVLAMPIIS